MNDAVEQDLEGAHQGISGRRDHPEFEVLVNESLETSTECGLAIAAALQPDLLQVLQESRKVV